MPKIFQNFTAEFIGTFVLVFIGCGSAIIAGSFIGNLGVALAFGFSLLVMAYAIGSISGCHINPAVSLSFLLTRQMSISSFFTYVAAQLLGAVSAGYILRLIASNKIGFVGLGGFAANGFDMHSPEGYSMISGALAEIITTAILTFTVLSTTRSSFPKGFGGIAAGIALTIGLLVAIPITNGSLNPARSFGVAPFAGGVATSQLWFFFVMPALGAVLGSTLHTILNEKKD